MAEYTVVYLNPYINGVRIMPLITDSEHPDYFNWYSEHKNSTKYPYAFFTVRHLTRLNSRNTSHKYLKVFKKDDPEINKYARRLKLLYLLDK